MRALVLISALFLWGSVAEACRITAGSQTEFPDSIVQSGDVTAFYNKGTNRYPHGVLGDDIEPTVLHVVTSETSASCGVEIELDAAHVFEDLAPRLADLDGDGVPEIITIRSHQNKGGQVAVYKIDGQRIRLHTTTPYIGQAFRWLAIIGIADFNKDGTQDIAFVDRPHLAKTLRVFSYAKRKLNEIAAAKGLTNHRIGEAYISSAVRDCGAKKEMILADASWQNVVAVTLEGQQLSSRVVGPFAGLASIEKAARC